MDNKNDRGDGGAVGKALNFIMGKGFYIVLILCIAAIGVSGYVIFKTSSSVSTPELPELPGELGLGSTVSYSGMGASTSAPDEAQAGVVTQMPAAGTTAAGTSSASSTRSGKVFYVRPLVGKVIAVYSGDTPVYSPTMDDWRVHTGIDIAADLGEPVNSVAVGTVSAVYTDYFKGTTVEITHLDGLVSVYCGLQSTPTVAKGDSVNAGTVIGAVGDSAIFEALDEPHLHFELRENGAYIDPDTKIPAPAN